MILLVTIRGIGLERPEEMSKEDKMISSGEVQNTSPDIKVEWYQVIIHITGKDPDVNSLVRK